MLELGACSSTPGQQVVPACWTVIRQSAMQPSVWYAQVSEIVLILRMASDLHTAVCTAWNAGQSSRCHCLADTIGVTAKSLARCHPMVASKAVAAQSCLQPPVSIS